MTANTLTMPALQGVWLPLVTPFTNDRLDEESVGRLISHYSKTGVSGFILAATTGESLSLDEDETRLLIETAQNANTRRLPIYLGRTGACTKELAQSIASTRGWPIDGYLIAAPYYVRPSQEGLYQHFSCATAETSRPIIVYNIPYRTGVNIENETMFRLAALPNIVGVKDCCANAQQTDDLIASRPPGFSVLIGDDANYFRNVSSGADGGILASAHLWPNGFVDVLGLIRQNRLEEARSIWESYSDMIPLLFAEPNPAPLKFCLYINGLIASPEVRLPMIPISAGLQEKLAARFSDA